MSTTTTTTSAIDPPMDPRPLRRSLVESSFYERQILYCGLGLISISFVWLGTLVSLYIAAVTQSQSSTFYEARWLLVTNLITGVMAVILYRWKYQSLYIACSCSAFYAIASAIVTVLAYGVNSHRLVPGFDDYGSASSLLASLGQGNRRQLIQLCVAMIIVSVFTLGLLPLLLFRLFQLGRNDDRFTGILQLSQGTSRTCFTLGFLEIALATFSLYVTSQIFYVKLSYVHTYMLQEMHCSIVLLFLAIMQVALSFGAQRRVVNGVFFRVLLALCVCQFFQELFYTWNAYYFALYLHSSNKLSFAASAQFDNVLMTINFLDHFIRMCLVGYVAEQLAEHVGGFGGIFSRGESARKLREDLSRNTLMFLAFGAALLFALAIGHIVQDIVYTSMEHIYRTLIAFTGVSVFYISVAALNLTLFVRRGFLAYLLISCVFLTLLLCISMHGVYIYLDVTFSHNLLKSLEALEKEPGGPSFLHFGEGFLALCGVCASLILGYAHYRLLRIESDYVQARKLGFGMKLLLAQAIAILVLTFIETCVALSVRESWKKFDTTISYNVIDILSMTAIGSLQAYISMPFNRYMTLHLIVLLFVLLAELLATFNYLNTYTTYIQLLIILHRLIGNQQSATSKVLTMFTTPQVAPLILNHCVQIVHWMLTVSSAITCGVVLERAFGTEELPDSGRRLTTAAENGTAQPAGVIYFTNAAYENPALKMSDEVAENPQGAASSARKGGSVMA